MYMQAFSFYLVYPFIILIALLPFKILYRLSDCCYHLLKFSGYRKKIILKNLINSFPDKSEEQIRVLSDEYYRYLCDLIMEIFKTLTTTEKEAREHCKFHSAPWLDKLCAEKQSIIVVMGHCGNWEWAGPSFTLNTQYQLMVVYRPLSNLYFEKMITGMRTKFGTRITPVNQTLRDMVLNRNEVTATALVADQTACAKDAYWTTFLNQDTAVFTGYEKLAKKFNYPVVYMDMKRISRGYYEVFPELMFANPLETCDNEISEAFTRRLEKQIKVDPAIWLWSHRRWKHTRLVV